MENINLTAEQKVLFNLVGHNLFDLPLEIDSSIEWKKVVDESIAQSVPALAFKNLRELPLDAIVAERIRIFLKKCTAININCYRGHAYLHDLMTKNGIPYCIIKGGASAFHYPDPLYRTMGDVDFYIPLEYQKKAREIFLKDGFELEDTDHRFHFGLKKDTMKMEFHFAPIAIPNESMRPVFLEYWSDICDRSSLVRDIFSDYVFPSDFHHGFILLTHFQNHLTRGGIGLRHLCDWAVFVNGFSNEDFVNIFESKLKRVGLWRLAQVISLAAVKYLGMQKKDWMGEDFDTADALIEDVACGGNFGRRDENRSFEILFVSNNSSSEKKRSRLASAFVSINNIIRQRWTAANKFPLLYPIGWVYFSLRFFFKRITGRRKVGVIKSYKESGRRLRLYKNLKLFEPQSRSEKSG